MQLVQFTPVDRRIVTVEDTKGRCGGGVVAIRAIIQAIGIVPVIL